MSQSDFELAQVLRGGSGPFSGVRLGDALAYEFELDESFVPRPGKTRLERVFVLLDLGVQLSSPPWWPDREAGCWYVDLVSVTRDGDTFTIRDQYVDVIVPTDGRPYRTLDLDEFAGAIEKGTLPLPVAIDALMRWQRFLDRHLHAQQFPSTRWVDFPPSAIEPLAALPAPLPSSKGT
jgi:hypothetical protein